MRINKNHNKRNLILLSVIGLLIIGGVASWYFVTTSARQGEENVVDYGSASDEQVEAGLKAKEDFNKVHYDNADQQKDAISNKEVSLLISSMNQSDDALTIATTINELVNNGTCKLTMSQASEVINMEVETVNLTNYSACEDFNVKVASITKGEWNVKVEYAGSGATGSTTSKVVIK